MITGIYVRLLIFCIHFVKICPSICIRFLQISCLLCLTPSNCRRFASKDELLTCYCGCTGCRGSVNTFGSDEEPTRIIAPRSELTKWIV